MKCTEFLSMLDEVIDENFAVETRERIERHINKCGHCEIVVNTTKQTIQIYQCHEIIEFPTSLRDRLHQNFMERCAQIKRSTT